MVSLADVAKAAGVSVTTASFVLNGLAEEKRISPNTAAKVLNTVRELGYIPNVAAKKLTSTSARSCVIPDIAVMWTPGLHSSFLGSFIINAQKFFDTNRVPQMRITIAPFPKDSLQNMDENYLDRHYNGAVFSPSFDSDLVYLKELALRIPIVVLHVPTNSFDNVIVDNYAGGCSAADIFVKNGHTSAEMLFHSYVGYSSVPDLRLAGFRDTCEMNRLAFSCTEIPPGVRGSVSSRSDYGKAVAYQYIKSGKLPEAIFIQDDAVASGFIGVLGTSGVRIPEDIEIITYGSDDLACAIHPSVTTINYPIEQITLETLNLIISQLSNPLSDPKQVCTIPTVTFRESCPKPIDY